MTRFSLYAYLLLALALCASPRPAHAAESYDNCTGFITSLPAVINTQGTWCLKQDLATAITGGAAIAVAASNVTLNCNDFKLGGLAAGVATSAYGVSGQNRVNVTVRRCTIRGFADGVVLFGTGGGHVIEDNRLDGNTFRGIHVEGDSSTVRRNLVMNTGGSTSVGGSATGIFATGSIDILDNSISDVAATSSTNNNAFGIETDYNIDGNIRGNRIRGVVKAGTNSAVGVFAFASDHLILRDNDIALDSSVGSIGLYCADANSSARDNTITRAETALSNCNDDGGNASHP